jgi:predicted nucleotidyltransferase
MNNGKPDFYSNDFVAICKAHKVKELFAFGSVIIENFTAESDVDLLVVIDHKKIH